MNMKLVIGSAALAVLAAGAVNAQGAATSSKSTATFSSVDANKDGHISKDEVKYMEELNGSFTKLDANADGMLSQAEFGKYSATGAPASQSSSTPSVPDSSTDSTSTPKADSTR
jgi:Ca2+-binding EF-hand superfamily protein